MKIIVAPDSFKGSLTARQAAAAIASGLRRVVPDAEIIEIPLADGGEGTVDALVAATGGQIRTVSVTGPLAEPVEAAYGIIPAQPSGPAGGKKTAVIEMAAAAGLPLVPPERRNPLNTTTYGLGELILDALEQHCESFIIGIGGSATNDCGTGMAQALGVVFKDRSGGPITEPMTGRTMGSVAAIDITQMSGALAAADFQVACDVQNPLLGPQGATRIYGPQKGAGPETLEILESNMQHIANLIEQTTSRRVQTLPASGAAGGLGAGLVAFLGAKARPGIDLVMMTCGFSEKLAGASLIITGEGRIDGQTVFGKTISGICGQAKRQAVPVVALAGEVGDGVEKVLGLPVCAVLSIVPGPMGLEEAVREAARLLADAAEQAMRLVLLELR